MNKTIAWLTSTLVFLIAIGSFILSYNALYQVALSNGINARLAWLWPLLVDVPMIVFSLCAIVAYSRSESTWQLWSLTSGYIVLTMGGNIIHAWPELLTPLTTRVIVTCIPPLSLLLSFEVLMMQYRNSVKRSNEVQEVTQIYTQEMQSLTEEVQQLTHKVSDPVTARREMLQEIIGSGHKMTNKALAGELGISTSTLRKDKEALGLNGVGK